MSFKDNAPSLRALGFSVFPTHAPGMPATKAMIDPNTSEVDPATIGKCPLVKWKPCQTTRTDDETFSKWLRKFPAANIAICAGPVSGLLILDVDGVGAAMALQKLEDTFEPLPDTWRVSTSRGCHIYFRYDGDDLRNTNGELGPGIESKTKGTTCHAVGSTHRSGHVYEWVGTLSPADLPLAAAPEWLLNLLRKKPQPVAAKPPKRLQSSPDTMGRREKAYRASAWDSMIAELATAPEGKRNTTLFKVAANARKWINAGQMESAEVEGALRMHAASIGMNALEIEATIKSATTAAGSETPNLPEWWGKVDAKSKPYTNGHHAPSIPASAGTSITIAPTPFDPETGEILEPPASVPIIETFDYDNDQQTPDMRRTTAYCATRQMTDLGNAQRMLAWFGDRIMHSAGTEWMVWDGMRWKRDNSAVMRMAHLTAHRMNWEIEHAGGLDEQRAMLKHQISSSSSDKLASMVRVASAIRTFDPARLDTNLWELNTASGIVDLRTGNIREHDPRALHTKLCPYDVAPEGDMPEKFIQFLSDVSCGDDELMEFHQRHLGYALTGSTHQQCLFFYYGVGRNGKTTLTEIMQAVMGDYAVTDTSDLILDTRALGNIETRMIRLHGARALFLQELKENSTLDVGVVKRITGTDLMIGRHLYEAHVQWRPTHKVFLASNHQPNVNDQTDGTWRRIRLIPFEARFEGSKEVLNLRDKLLAEEGPQILRWLIDGAVRGANGAPLPTPGRVVDATAMYREDEDILAEFVNETFDLHDDYAEKTTEIYDAFIKWCAYRRESRMSKWTSMHFGKKMSERGFRRMRSSNARKLRGLQFKPISATPWRQQAAQQGSWERDYSS